MPQKASLTVLALIRYIALNLLSKETSAKVGKKLNAQKLDGTAFIWLKFWLDEYAFAPIYGLTGFTLVVATLISKHSGLSYEPQRFA